MTLAEQMPHASHFGERSGARGRRHIFRRYESLDIEWPDDSNHGIGYDYEEELCDQLDRLPAAEHVDEVLTALRIATLRELSKEVVKGGIEYVKGDSQRLEYMRLLNSWVATAEETIVAGRNVNRIAGRRSEFTRGS